MTAAVNALATDLVKAVPDAEPSLAERMMNLLRVIDPTIGYGDVRFATHRHVGWVRGLVWSVRTWIGDLPRRRFAFLAAFLSANGFVVLMVVAALAVLVAAYPAADAFGSGTDYLKLFVAAAGSTYGAAIVGWLLNRASS